MNRELELVMIGIRNGLDPKTAINLAQDLELLKQKHQEQPEEPKLPHPLRGAAKYLSREFIKQLSHDTTPQNTNRSTRNR